MILIVDNSITGGNKWRNDGRCSSEYLLPNGEFSECDPNGEAPCCDDYDRCVKSTDRYCHVDYSLIYKDWRESAGTQRWRYDGKCGVLHPLPDGSPAECNPDGEEPCCNRDGECDHEIHKCMCPDCVDYRMIREVRESGKLCAIVQITFETILSYTYLKYVCFDESTKQQYFKCTHSDRYYTTDFDTYYVHSFSQICDKDPHAYQVCGFGAEVTNTDVLCKGYICGKKKLLGSYNYESDRWQERWWGHEYIECSGDDCGVDKRDCREELEVDTTIKCDDKCDKWSCEDEGNCNGYQYGITCKKFREEVYVRVDRICDGSYSHCDNRADEKDCDITKTNNTDAKPCIHYERKYSKSSDKIVPIHDYTRCSVFNTTGGKYPYCWDYLDQINCPDIERVGGYCEVNGLTSSVSKYVVCYEVDPQTGQSIKLCDDDFQNNCLYPSINDCEIHKHKLCNGDTDCLDNADEVNDLCEVMTKDFKCIRRFLPKKGKIELPVSWIMDGEKDCIDGEDEDLDIWKYCSKEFGQIKVPSKSCENVYNCPRGDKQFVPFDQLCDGVESCGDGGENDVCRISRDFPPILRKASDNNKLSPCIDPNVNCATTEFIRPQGNVFGEAKIDLLAPTSRVKCNELFGENYLYLSCMDLCVEEDVKCPLTDSKRKLDYDSCPGQYENRAVTLGNNSYLTFLDVSNTGNYHQNIFQCNNSRCVEYSQVCDLVDDCGDMSDEMNCANHMTCKNTLELDTTKHQFIALSQKCDGIYDCFDLSDECNDSCKTLYPWELGY